MLKSKIFGTVLRVMISFGALGLIIYFMRGHLKEAVHILASDVSWKWVGVAFAGYFLANIFLGWRLKFVLGVQDVALRARDAIYLSFVGLFFNLFLPSAVGGDVAKGYYIYKHTGNKLASTASVVLDRLLGFVSLISMGGIAVVFLSKELGDPRVRWTVFFFVSVMVLMVIFFTQKAVAKKFKFLAHLIPSDKWRTRLEDFYHTIHDCQNHPKQISTAVGFAFLAQISFIFVHFWAALALGVKLDPVLFFGIVPVITIVSMAPSLGGLGVREAGTIFMFSQFMPSERALALSLLLDLVIYSFCLGSGILYALKGGLKANPIDEAEIAPPSAT